MTQGLSRHPAVQWQVRRLVNTTITFRVQRGSEKGTYSPTRELPGVALVNISTRQIFMGKGNILNYIDILK